MSTQGNEEEGEGKGKDAEEIEREEDIEDDNKVEMEVRTAETMLDKTEFDDDAKEIVQPERTFD